MLKYSKIYYVVPENVHTLSMEGQWELALKGKYYNFVQRGEGGTQGVLPYMSYIGMCRCEGYGFQQVYSRIGCSNQTVLV